ncbi:hypothetical protein CDO73_16905 [Saccharibacillus sp. O23]|nr:hypothetical protein CDO73_16905 [Saccharibacillus sp. O23]
MQENEIFRFETRIAFNKRMTKTRKPGPIDGPRFPGFRFAESRREEIRLAVFESPLFQESSTSTLTV